jgi:hypothetical protein
MLVTLSSRPTACHDARRARDDDIVDPVGDIRYRHGAHLAGGAQPRVPVVVKEAVFAVPGDLATPTGGYTYDRRIISEFAGLGWQIEVQDLGGGFPRPPLTRGPRRVHSLRRCVLGARLPGAPKMLAASYTLSALVRSVPLAQLRGSEQRDN